MAYILAHDIGTSGNKATLYSEDGTLLKSCIYTYPTKYFNDNWAEQNPLDWWKALCESSKKLLCKVNTKELSVVSFSGHMMGCLCVDKNGIPLRNSIIYCDQRAEDQNQEILNKLDAFDFYKITGHRASPAYSLQKLMWIRSNEPDIYKNTYKVLNVKDYVAYKLTGNMATDFSDAGGTEAFDIVKMTWSDKILDAVDVDRSKFPQALMSTAVVGQVTKKAEQESGIPAGTPVVIGAGDGCAAGVGAGSHEEGQTYTSIGSSAWVATSTMRPIFDKHMRTTTFPHAIPNMYHPCGAMQAAGTSYSWSKKIFYAESGQKNLYDVMNEDAKASAAGANGVIFLPYLMGERSPRWNTKAKGAFVGLKLTNTRADMMRAVIEGVLFNLNIIKDIYKEYTDISEMNFVGGTAKGDIWRQIMANIYGMKINKPKNITECASMGAAIIGGVGIGLFKDFKYAKRFIEVETVNEPDMKIHTQYKELQEIFDNCYDNLELVFKKI